MQEFTRMETRLTF